MPTGKPIPLAEPGQQDEEGRFRFNHECFRLIENKEKLADTPIVIISVAGAFRKGKSFMLNFFLRFLKAFNRGDTRDWIRSVGRLDDGFPWRSGSERDTAGILIWSEPFFIRKPNGKEVAVLLMDTQGTFDSQSTLQDCTTIFAFSTLMSSVQIFNISQNIQETDLQHLRLFVEFASMAKTSKEKVLQHLWFLIRDWQNPDEYDYGTNGGKKYLGNALACDDRKPRENQELRQGIRQHFELASCCLLPHPGRAVTRQNFRGEIEALDGEFVEHLDQFVRHILSPENLVVKKVNGKELTGRELFSLVDVYFEAFRLGKLPTPRSIFTATVEMANQTASEDARKFFEESMSSLAGPTEISDQELNSLLMTMLEQAMEHFDGKCMERGSRDTARTREKLESQLRGLFQQQQMLNQLKSDRIAAEEKNRMLMGDMKRMQDETLEASRRMHQMQEEFANKVTEIQSSAVSKEEMEAMLQQELVKHSLAQKELERRNEALVERIEEMAERNQELASELRNRDQAMQQQQAQMNQWKAQMEAAEEERRKAAENSPGILTRIARAVLPNFVLKALRL